MKYGNRTNTAENMKILATPETHMHVLTVYDDKILDYDARKGPITKKIIDKYWVVDLAKKALAKTLGAAGETDKAIGMNDQAKSKSYKDLLQQYARESKRVENAPYTPVHSILGNSLGAAGNLIDTAYEVVRRINDLTDVTGKQYRDENYQAVNAVNVVPTEDLNIKGVIKSSALLQGQPEIADNVTPDLAEQVFARFEKSLYADSFRYEFGMREIKDSVISLESEMKKEVPGLFLRMQNDKIITILNAETSQGDLADWDDVGTNTFTYVNDAAGDIETADNGVEAFGGADLMIAPRGTIRLYKRNVQGGNVQTAPSGEAKNARQGVLPFNEHITYLIDNAVTAASLIVLNKKSYIDHYKGPVLNITYTNEKTPGQVKGVIDFNFNTVVKKNAGAAYRNIGVT